MKQLATLLITFLMMTAMTGFAQNTPDGGKAVLDNIFARKSVRTYTDQPVSPEQVETILKAAMAAPTGMNVQPWRFVVVRNQDVKEKLAGRNTMIAKAPVVIVVCGQAIRGGRENQNWTADCLDGGLCGRDGEPPAGRRSHRPGRRLDGLLSVRGPHEPHHRGPGPARGRQTLLHCSCGISRRQRQTQGQVEAGKHPLREVVAF